MADITVSSGAPAPAVSSDPAQLHMQAMNSLNRCKAELMDAEPIYLLALDFLAEAQKAVNALRALKTGVVHQGEAA